MSSNQNSQQGQQTPANNQNGEESKLMTQAEYLKYKQEDSNSNNFYEFSREATVGPVAWVREAKSY